MKITKQPNKQIDYSYLYKYVCNDCDCFYDFTFGETEPHWIPGGLDILEERKVETIYLIRCPSCGKYESVKPELVEL